MRYILLVLLAFVTTFASAQVQYLGSPTTTVRNRGNFVSDSLFYLPKRQVAPSDTAAMRYAIADSSVYVWTGNAWRRIGRAGASFLSVSDTSSMLSPYIRAAGNGLTKSGQSLLVDTAAIATRARVQKAVDSINSNVALKINISDTASMLTPYTRGSGTTNYLPKFTGTRTFGNSLLFDNGTQVGVNTNGPAYALDVNGTFRSVNGSNFATTSGQVAIGTATTAGKVRIAGDAFDVNTQTSYALVLGNPNTDYSIGADASYVYHQSWNSKAILFNNLGNNTIMNPSSGSVAIGNTSPSYKLDITGTLRSTGNTFLGTSSSEVYVNTTTDAGAYALQVAGTIYTTNDAYIGASSGRLGVGTTTPAAKITSIQSGVVTATNSAFWASHDASANPLDGIGIGTNGNSSYKWIQTYGGALSLNSAGNDVLINTTTDAGAYALQVAGSIYNTTGAVLAASSGSIGIGTTSTAYKLNVAGSVGVSGGGNGYVFGLTDANTRITGDNSGGANTYIEMRTNGANRLRIQEDGEILLNNITDAGAYALQVAGSIYNTTGAVLAATSGNVGIGTTSPASSLHVYSPSSSEVLRLQYNGPAPYMSFYNGSNRNGYIQFDSTNGTIFRNETNTPMVFHTSSIERMRITSTGNVGIGTTAPSQPLHVNGNILTAAPSGGTAKPFKIGEAATVSPTSPNRTIRVEIDGTVYYIHAKTTND